MSEDWTLPLMLRTNQPRVNETWACRFFWIAGYKTNAVFNCSEAADLNHLMCILSFQGSATHLFLAPLSFLKEEYEQHILSKGTVLCAVSGIHDEQLNHAVGESLMVCISVVARMHTCTTTDPSTTGKTKNVHLNLEWVVKKKPKPASPGARMGCDTTRRMTSSKILTIIKTPPPSAHSCPWRCKIEPDTERTELRREKKKENERKNKKRGKTERKSKQEKGNEMEKSSLSGFGNSDSWGPFVLITAEQHFCRY